MNNEYDPEFLRRQVQSQKTGAQFVHNHQTQVPQDYRPPDNNIAYRPALLPPAGGRGIPLKNAYNRLGFGYLLLFIGYFLGSILVSVFAVIFIPGAMEAGWLDLLVTTLAIYGFGFPLMMLPLKGLPNIEGHRHEPKDLSLGKLLALLAFSFLLVYVFGLLSDLINDLIGIVVPGYSTETIMDFSGMNEVLLFIYGVVVAPFMEELLFRWIPYKKLGHYGMGSYVFYTALAFGLFHQNLAQFFYAVVVGIVFAVVTYRTGKYLYSVILHSLINLLGGIGLGGLVISYGGEVAMGIYSLFVLAVLGGGLVVTIVALVRRRRALADGWRRLRATTVGRAFLNPGTIIMITYAFFTIIVLIFSVAAMSGTNSGAGNYV